MPSLGNLIQATMAMNAPGGPGSPALALQKAPLRLPAIWQALVSIQNKGDKARWCLHDHPQALFDMTSELGQKMEVSHCAMAGASALHRRCITADVPIPSKVNNGSRSFLSSISAGGQYVSQLLTSWSALSHSGSEWC